MSIHLKNDLPLYLSIAIGSMEFSPLELTFAYSAFAQNGTIYRPSPHPQGHR